MSNYPVVPLLPENGGDDALDGEETATKEVDGERVLDPDANDELLDSAEADRIAAEGDD